MEAPAWSLVCWHQSSPKANCHATTIKWAATAWYQRKVSIKSCLPHCRHWASCRHNWRWLVPKRIIICHRLAMPPLTMANTNENLHHQPPIMLPLLAPAMLSRGNKWVETVRLGTLPCHTVAPFIYQDQHLLMRTNSLTWPGQFWSFFSNLVDKIKGCRAINAQNIATKGSNRPQFLRLETTLKDTTLEIIEKLNSQNDVTNRSSVRNQRISKIISRIWVCFLKVGYVQPEVI